MYEANERSERVVQRMSKGKGGIKLYDQVKEVECMTGNERMCTRGGCVVVSLLCSLRGLFLRVCFDR